MRVQVRAGKAGLAVINTRVRAAVPIMVPSPVQNRRIGRLPEQDHLPPARRTRVDRGRRQHAPTHRIAS